VLGSPEGGWPSGSSRLEVRSRLSRGSEYLIVTVTISILADLGAYAYYLAACSPFQPGGGACPGLSCGRSGSGCGLWAALLVTVILAGIVAAGIEVWWIRRPQATASP
jgi:hypothetical protein